MMGMWQMDRVTKVFDEAHLSWLTGPNCDKSTSLKSDIKGHYAVITTIRPVKSAFKLK